jgi:high-affinity K+ transport system ATPase subunit B
VAGCSSGAIKYFVEVSRRHCVPKEICFTECLVHLFQVHGNVISSIHFAYSHSRVRQMKAITSVSYFVTLISTIIFLISNFRLVLNVVFFILGNSSAS